MVQQDPIVIKALAVIQAQDCGAGAGARMSGSPRTSTGIRYFVIVLCFSLSNHVRLASGWAQSHSNVPYSYQDFQDQFDYENNGYGYPEHIADSEPVSQSWFEPRFERFDLDQDHNQDSNFNINFNDYEGYEHERPDYRSDQIIVNEEGIPVRVVWPVGYRPPPPRPTPRPQPTTTVSPFAIQIAELNKQEQEALAAKKLKKKKQKQKRPSDPLLEQEDDYDEYDDQRDQYDEEEEHEYADVDTNSEELNDDYGDYDDGDGDASSEDLDDLGGGGGGGGGGPGGWYGGSSGAAAVASGWYGGAGGGWGGIGNGGGGGGGGGKKKKKNKNKGKNKKRKCKRKKGQNCNQGPPRPPPWEKWAPLPRPQRLQEVEKWGYQNEYNRGWGKNKHLAEKQKAAWIAARKREAQYKEWFENLPEEQQEAIVRGQMEQRRRVQYHAYGYAQREIGGLPLAPSGPSHDYFPPPGTPTVGRGPTGGGGWTTRII